MTAEETKMRKMLIKDELKLLSAHITRLKARQAKLRAMISDAR